MTCRFLGGALEKMRTEHMVALRQPAIPQDTRSGQQKGQNEPIE